MGPKTRGEVVVFLLLMPFLEFYLEIQKYHSFSGEGAGLLAHFGVEANFLVSLLITKGLWSLFLLDSVVCMGVPFGAFNIISYLTKENSQIIQ